MESIFQTEFVISGMAGRFPESQNLDEFWQNLIQGKDMVSEDDRRWDLNTFNVPRRAGKLQHLDKFDADFFGVHGKQADVMDPRLRFVLELTHEALLDAGVNPTALRGTNTGVFVGAAGEEALSIWKRSSETPNCYASLGTPISMLSNRISFAFDFHGPSYTVDSSCSASSLALQNALLALRSGQCDSAIVSGVQIAFCPFTSVMFKSLELTSPDGMCKAFDSSGNGYVRSEAAVVFYICKKDVAKRSYATLVHAKCNSDGYKEQGITFPSGALQERLIREVYRECGVSPLDVDYVEAHGTGTKAGDPQEVNALANVFCEGRQGPLLIGSVKSNMGHAEVASGVAGLAKILLSHRFGKLPANLHFNHPNQDIPGLLDGRLKVVTENTPFNGRYAALSSFGFGGTNVHVLLKLHPKEPLTEEHKLPIPVLLLASGRTSESTAYHLNAISSDCYNPNLIALTHETFKTNISRHPYRGYGIMSESEPQIHIHNCLDDARPPIWFIFTGLGSQWVGMTRDMMVFKAFNDSIQKSARILLKNGFDLFKVLETEDSEILEDLKNSIVSITCVQIGLVDLLSSLGIHPEGIVGHSTGECASAYADGCFTQEQAVLVSLGRARAFLESDLPPGTVAAVGLSWEEATRRCPEGIYPAIHNSKDNVTISGPPEKVRIFLEELQAEGIFAREVKSAVYGFHSPYVAASEKLMRTFLGKVIPEAKPRSPKWLSSSIPESLWSSNLAQFSSVDYHVNNALSPVYFYATLKYIPANSIVLEIGPHCFMQTILKQGLDPLTTKLGLMNRNSPDNSKYFLNSLGKLYQLGVNFDAGLMYDPVRFPVDPSTPIISPMIKWDHSLSWDVPNIKNEISKAGGTKFIIDLSNESDSFFAGHAIEGRIVFPATGYIWLVWRAFSQQRGVNFEQLPVVMENIRFERSTVMDVNNPVGFIVTILEDNGEFEVLESNVAVCRGSIRLLEKKSDFEMFKLSQSHPRKDVQLDKQGFYKELRLRGYQYYGIFQGVSNIDKNGEWAEVNWNDNWVGFLDTVLQTGIVRHIRRGLHLPIRLEKVTIDPERVKKFVKEKSSLIPIQCSRNLDTTQCPGVEFRGLKASLASRRASVESPILSEHKYIPYNDPPGKIFSTSKIMEFFVGIAIDNTFGRDFILTEILTDANEAIATITTKLCKPKFQSPELRLIVSSQEIINSQIRSKVITFQELNDLKLSNLIFTDTAKGFNGDFILNGGFLIYKGTLPNTGIQESLTLVSQKHTSDGTCVLFRKISNLPSMKTFISIDTEEFSWLEDLKVALKSGASKTERIVLTSKATSGMLGLVKCLIMEHGCENIRCICYMDDKNFNIEESKEQLNFDLVFNVRRNNEWGCYANITIPEEWLEKPRPTTHAYANAMVTGDLSSLCWIESSLKLLQQQDNPLCQVHFASLNFRDIMLATGKLSRDALPGESAFEDCVLGLEFSGIYRGKKVCGLHTGKCLATSVLPESSLLWEVPESWSLAQAATVPVVYATAFYALLLRGGLKSGETVLIHAGSGGVGQAAIALALHMNCTVYTTVGSLEKRKFLQNQFSKLKPENIADSRDAQNFEKCVREGTNGKGVDVILNSLAQDKLQASVRCLAKYGRFLEIGKYDLFNDSKFGMSVLLKSTNIQGILLDDVMQGESQEKLQLVKLVHDGIASGLVKPLPYTSFKQDQLEEAFRYMATGKHIGKVIVNMESLYSIPALRRTYFYSNKVYILIGGLGGMGLEIANWMIERGAHYLVLNSRSGVKTAYQEYRIGIFRQGGVNVILDQTDVSTRHGATSLIRSSSFYGPIGGILNASLVLNDGIFENQSVSTFEETCKSKGKTTIELDRASRVLAPELDYFVVFSSIVSARGNIGQANYGYANSFMERICEQRRADDLPALAIQWGLIGDVGIVAEVIGAKTFGGLSPQSMHSWLHTLDLLLQESITVVSSLVLEDICPVYSDGQKECLISAVAHVLAIKDVSKVNHKATLTELGMDSLMAAEIKQIVDSKTNLRLPLNAYGQLTFVKLSKLQEQGMSNTEILNSSTTTTKQFPLQPVPRESIVRMKSGDASSEDTIFIVHPIDGTLFLLERLVSHIEGLNVFGLQCVPEAPLNSMEALARFYIAQIRKVQQHGPYKLAGYSFGSAVAFEMAVQLERESSQVSLLLLLDGCPKWQAFFTKSFIEKGIKHDENSWLLYFMMLHMSLPDPTCVEGELDKLRSFNEKVLFTAKTLREVYVNFSVQDIMRMAISFVGRLKIGYSYDPAEKISSRVILMKSVLGGFDKVLGHDYGLSEYCHNKVEIIDVDGHHHCFHENPLQLRIPSIINNLLQ